MESRNKNTKVTLKIPRPLYDKITKVIEGSGYNSVTDFVVYVMRDMVASSEMSHNQPDETAQIHSVKQRLRALGYLE